MILEWRESLRSEERSLLQQYAVDLTPSPEVPTTTPSVNSARTTTTKETLTLPGEFRYPKLPRRTAEATGRGSVFQKSVTPSKYVPPPRPIAPRDTVQFNTILVTRVVVVAIFEKTSEVGQPLKSALDLLINDFPNVSFAMVAGNTSRLLVQQQISSFPTVRGYVDAECRYEWDGKDIANLQIELRLLLDSASVPVAPVLRARFGQEPYLVSTYYPDPPPGTIPRVLTTLLGFINLQQFSAAVDTGSATPVPNPRQWMELLIQVDVIRDLRYGDVTAFVL